MTTTELRLFTTQWCPPCKKFKKILKPLKEQYPNVVYTTIDMDDLDEEDANYNNITMVPTVRIYKDGELHKEFTYVLRDLDEIVSLLRES